MVRDVIYDILPDIWPMVIIITVIVSTLRLAYVTRNKKSFCLYKELLGLMFMIYILCLFHIVTFQDVNYGTNNFIPFKEIFRYDVGSYKFIKNIIGNIIMFIPYGFFASYYLKNRKFGTIAFLTLIVSTTIEFVQMYIGRVFDIDDIILNLVGGIVGFLLFVGLDAIKSKLPKVFSSNWFLNLLVIILIILMVVYLFNINIFGLYKLGWI